MLAGVEDRNSFVHNFNVAYERVANFEVKNEEFKSLFVIKKNRHTQHTEMKFTHPIR